jgi:hypothetical protein
MMKRLTLFVFLSLMLPVGLHAAERTTLYGMTYDGILLKIDRITGAGTFIRQLAGEYHSIDSLEFTGNRFYASYDGGKMVKFGFTDGDEVALGDSGFPHVEALAARSDDSLFASLSQDNDFAAESVGAVNLLTGAITGVVSSADQSIAYDMDAIAFDTFDRLYGINLENPRKLFQINPNTGAISNAVDLTRIYWALTIQPRFDFFFASHAHSVSLTNLSSELFLIDPATGNETFVGDIGFNNVSGLTFGPVPEPSSMLALSAGLVGLIRRKRRRISN